MEQNETVLVDADVVSTEENTSSNNQLMIIEKEVTKPAERVICINVTLDQKGIKNADKELVDPDNNTFFSMKVEATGVLDIAKVAGRIAQSLYVFHKSLDGVKGVKRMAGFNINLEITDSSASEDSKVKYEVISKMKTNEPIDAAFKIGTAILVQCEAENASNLMTGDFQISKEGQLLRKKLGLDEMLDSAPINVFDKYLREKKGNVKRNVKAIKKSIADKE